MSPEIGKAAVKISMWIIVTSAMLMFVVKPGTPSFYINIIAFVLGFLLLGVIALAVRTGGRG